jgi:hypothetical protein
MENCCYSEAEKGSVLHRNDNGTGFRKDGSTFKYGLDPGSGDQIGWKSITITPNMIGKKIAVFQSIEIKTLKDQISYTQIIWYLNVRNAGGIAQVYTEDRFLTHGEVMLFPRRKEKPEKEAIYLKIIRNLTKKT